MASLVSSLVAPDTLNGAVVTTAELANRETSCRPIGVPGLVPVVLTMLFPAVGCLARRDRRARQCR